MLATPNADLLLLGAGQAYFAPFDDDGIGRRWRHLGNCEAIEDTTTDDPLIKRSSMTAARPVYKKVNRGREVVLRVVGNEFDAHNMALMTMGDVAYTTQAATTVTDRVLLADVDTYGATLGAAIGDRYFFVGNLLIDTVSMKIGATALDADDFVVHNADMGIIKILGTSTTAVAAGADLLVTFTPVAITGTDAPVVRGGTQPTIEGAFMYVADNSSGPNGILIAHSVSVTPDGALGLISDEFATFALNLTVQADAAGNHGGTDDNPLYSIQYLPDAA